MLRCRRASIARPRFLMSRCTGSIEAQYEEGIRWKFGRCFLSKRWQRRLGERGIVISWWQRLSVLNSDDISAVSGSREANKNYASWFGSYLEIRSLTTFYYRISSGRIVKGSEDTWIWSSPKTSRRTVSPPLLLQSKTTDLIAWRLALDRPGFVFVLRQKSCSQVLMDTTYLDPYLPALITQFINLSQGFKSTFADCRIRDSKWYYEVDILASNLFQIGWAPHSPSFLNSWDGSGTCNNFFPIRSKFFHIKGTGDDEESFAFDGNRILAWNGASISYGEKYFPDFSSIIIIILLSRFAFLFFKPP